MSYLWCREEICFPTCRMYTRILQKPGYYLWNRIPPTNLVSNVHASPLQRRWRRHHNNSHDSKVFHHSPVGVLQLAGLLERDDAGQGLQDLLKGLQVHRQLLHRAGSRSRDLSLKPHQQFPLMISSSHSTAHLPAGERAWPGTDRAPEFSPPSPSPPCSQFHRPSEDSERDTHGG